MLRGYIRMRMVFVDNASARLGLWRRAVILRGTLTSLIFWAKSGRAGAPAVMPSNFPERLLLAGPTRRHSYVLLTAM